MLSSESQVKSLTFVNYTLFKKELLLTLRCFVGFKHNLCAGEEFTWMDAKLLEKKYVTATEYYDGRAKRIISHKFSLILKPT